MPGDRARQAVAGTRFADVRWSAETGSTNADALELARQGEPEGIVLVAEHQRAGRGRQGRTWTAPPGASLLATVLLRPPAAVLGATTHAMAVAAAEAVDAVAGFAPRLKWPNDLVWPGDSSAPDRKLAGILAEAEWPSGASIADGWRPTGRGERAVVAVGIGVNVTWPADLPEELADVAVAINHVTGAAVDREELLIALLTRLDEHYGQLLSGTGSSVSAAWRARSATLGRRVRVDLGTHDVEGIAVDVNENGHLVVETSDGQRNTLAVGDVVHLRVP